MYIENRRNKKYSDKLFNELCLISLIVQSNGIFRLRLLEKYMKVSDRTLFRYFDELREIKLISEISIKTKNNEKYIICNDVQKASEVDAAVEQYMINNLNSETNNVASCRLARLAYILLNNIWNFSNADNFDEDVIYDRKYSKKFEDDTFAFETFTIDERIYKDLNKRTSQRDADLVKTVIVQTYEI